MYIIGSKLLLCNSNFSMCKLPQKKKAWPLISFASSHSNVIALPHQEQSSFFSNAINVYILTVPTPYGTSLYPIATSIIYFPPPLSPFQVDYEFDASSSTFKRIMNCGEKQFSSNLSTLLRWSPFSTEGELLNQVSCISSIISITILFCLFHDLHF